MVRSTSLRRRWTISLLAVPIALAVATLRAPAPAVAPPAVSAQLAESPPAATAVPFHVQAPIVEAAPAQSAAPPTAVAIPTTIPTQTPSVVPTPSPRAAGVPLRVGIQAGHWLSKELPDELARLRSSSGAFAAGYAEAQVNLDIAKRVAKLLESRGMAVDVLPATIPPSYDADAFVAIHADGSSSGNSRGFKLATPWRTSRASQHLADTLTQEYARATGLPQDGAITFNMKGYYAFNNRRHTHAIAKTTPGVIIETGFLTSAADRRLLIDQPDNIAIGIANGIIRYLSEHDPNDGASLIPPDFKTQRPVDPAGLDVRAAPNDKAKLLKHIGADGRIFIFQERDGWYQGVIRGDFRMVGWVRKDQVIATDDPPPTPPPATDS
jgi:N-acetylmuramoyl-L-alanine amidase